MNKMILRKEALKKRDALDQSRREDLSGEIAKILLNTAFYNEADVILSYASFRSEVDTTGIHRQILADGKKLCLPKTFIERREMEFYYIDENAQMKAGYQGILEPDENQSVQWLPGRGQKVLMLMPGVAFDEQLHRIGYGGGYYDRFLAGYKGETLQKIMLAFSCQQTDFIEVEKTDVSPDEIVTENGMVKMR